MCKRERWWTGRVTANRKRTRDAGLTPGGQYARFFAGRGPETIGPLVGYL